MANPEKLRKFKSENKLKENILHQSARRKAREIAKEFGLKLTEERIFNPYIVDLFIKKINVAIEIDGGIHENKQGYDNRRDNYLSKKYGVTVLRFTPEDIRSGLFRKTIWWCCYQYLIDKIKRINLKAKECGFSECIPDILKPISEN